MSSIIKVDTVQDIDGNNIINENANTITIGASGDTITIPAGATLSSTDPLVFPAGTVSAPAITTTGDTNTGIFFPAADTIAFTEGGTEAMRIDSDGNVGIGITSPTTQLHLSSNNPTISFTDGASTATISGDSANLTYTTTSTNRDHFFKAGATNLAEINGDGNLKFNSGFGSVTTVYGCRSWVNFNGTGTVAIRASGNVSSVTDNDTGYYTVNLTTAMPDINCAVLLSNGNGTPNAARDTIKTGTMVTTSSFYISLYSGGALDSDFINAAVFR